MRPLRFGVLGCASVARRHALPALATEPSVSLVAVASREIAKAREFARPYGCAAVEGYDAVLERDDVDAVYVPLPAALHAEWIRRAIRAGKHVLAEKPLATEAATAAGLVRSAAAAGVLLMENFAFLHHGQHATACRMLEDGVIGELRQVTAEFGFPPMAPDDIRYRPDLGGGALLDAGVYPIRTARWFLGDEAYVAGARLREDPSAGVDVGGAALLAAPGGRTASVSFGFDRSYRCAYTLWGSTGRISLLRAYSAPPGLRTVLRVEHQDSVEERVLAADTQFANIFRRFARAVADRGPAAGTGADIVRQAELVQAVADAAGARPRAMTDSPWNEEREDR